MGALVSKKESIGSDEDLFNRINELKNLVEMDIGHRLEKLEESADLNSDGIVTRKEMETYLTTQLQAREEELIGLREALKGEKEKHDLLAERYEQLRELYNTEKEDDPIPVSRISSDTLKKYVEEMLKDPKDNWGFLPDVLEKPTKVKEYKVALSLLEKLFTLGHFDIAGHRIQMSIRPIEE